ncbi:MAG: NAD(P) transhydrogenase subunit alpha [Rickettsiaceae bacterium]|nr:NAD(P) transhydrogenase subunit alpha [Rickettsiaceae bacterium]
MTINIQSMVQQASEISLLSDNLAEKLRQLSTMQEGLAHKTLDPLVFAVTIFVLACFVGYYVVWKVTPSLHTPLMSVTNAISGIIIVGSMVAAAGEFWHISSIFGIFAIFLASINIFGGFIVTMRMLKMFRKK